MYRIGTSSINRVQGCRPAGYPCTQLKYGCYVTIGANCLYARERVVMTIALRASRDLQRLDLCERSKQYDIEHSHHGNIAMGQVTPPNPTHPNTSERVPLWQSVKSFSMSLLDLIIRQLVGRLVLPANPSCSLDGT